MKHLTLIGALILGSAAYGQDCSADAIQTKSAQVTTALQTIGEKDPAREEALSTEMDTLMTAIEQGGDIATVCGFFDKVIAEAEG